MAYATGDDLALRYDIDWVGDLATDNRESLSRGAVASHPAVQVALDGASGQVQAALIQGGQYSVDDLATLTGVNKAYLADLVCGLAIIRLWERRSEAVPDNAETIQAKWWGLIEKLEKGGNIFDLPAQIDATIVDHTGPTAVQLQNRNDMTVRNKLFPPPITRLPRAQGGGI
ncbi:MAG: hypothetical protein CMP95_02825 [Gammaproteobacteria bacterium]|jgi:phage gp36-like protein|nr:hypothetical protein [Gammaproteobacteria bacterium]|tara:strand:+ start:19853 stop:20368 length:516 start_codon:yes stop_codon:yes gene_type:complete